MRAWVHADACILLADAVVAEPAGKLFAAMHAVDADALVRYHFPTERLPTHTQVRSMELISMLLARHVCQTFVSACISVCSDAEGAK